MKSSTVAFMVNVLAAGSKVPRLIIGAVERLSRQIDTYSFRKLSYPRRFVPSKGIPHMLPVKLSSTQRPSIESAAVEVAVDSIGGAPGIIHIVTLCVQFPTIPFNT